MTAEQDQKETENKFHNDLQDVKAISDAILTLVVNLPKSTREQLLAAAKTFIDNRKVCDPLAPLTNDCLRAMGNDIVQRLIVETNDYNKHDADFDARTMGDPGDPRENAKWHAEHAQWVADFMERNKTLFQQANFVRNVILIRLGQKIPEAQWFDPTTLSATSLPIQTYSLKELVEKIPR